MSPEPRYTPRGRPPMYNRSSTVAAVRLPEDVRRILDWLVLRTGADSVSGYLRAVLEDHLRGLGFQLEPGRHLPRPSRTEIEAFQATERDHPAVDNPVGPVDSLPSARVGD